MPGLLRGMARTAVVAGTATAVVGGMKGRQQKKAARQDAAHAEQAQAYQDEQAQQLQDAAHAEAMAQQAPAPAPADAGLGELDRLAQMHTQGLLTDDEFAAAKAKLLGL